MDRITILIVILLAGTIGLSAQKIPTKGVPLINNYTPLQYGEVGKTWSIQSAANGIVYFATDEGLLEFDGHRWKHFKGNKGFTRSLHIYSDSLLQTGADKDFGLWRRDSLGAFRFSSLNPFRESAKGPNEQFWGTYEIDEELVFISFENIYIYKDGQLTKITAPNRFSSSFTTNKKLYLVDEKAGLFEFDGLNLLPVFKFTLPSPTLQIIGAYEAVGGLMIVTRGQGLFRLIDGGLSPIAEEVSAHLKRDQVFCFTPIDDAHYAFGTILNGVYITDLEGRIIQHINKRKGLLNNTVLSVHYSDHGKLWLGLDFGIASIDLWSDVAYFLDQEGKTGTGQTATLHEGTFYLGTNQGLYRTSWENLKNDVAIPDFQLVPGSYGQVWSLEIIDGELLCGHDRGIFRIVNNTFEQILGEAGTLSIHQIDANHLLTGNYNGISLLKRRGKAWEFVRRLTPIQGAVSQIIQSEDDALWINLPNFGVIKAILNEDRNIIDQQIFPSDQFKGAAPFISLESSTIKVFTSEAIYQYQPTRKQFEVQNGRPPAPSIRNLLTHKYLPDSLTANHGFFPVHNGFALKNIGYKGLHPGVYPLLIRSVMAFDNDTSILIAPGKETIPYHLNNLHIHFIVPQQNEVVYQYYLENHSSDWSAWSPQRSAEFVNLPEGEYTLKVRAKVDGIVTPEKSGTIVIGAPWYRSSWAYAGFLLLLFALFYLNYLWQEIRLKRQKKRLKEKEKAALRLQAAAEERINLMKRYEMLEDALGEVKKQLRGKTIELARKAKESDTKGRLLQALRDKVDLAQKEKSTSNFHWSQLSRLLADYPEKKDNSFSIQMEELHQNFLSNLNARYPELTTYDLRLCAYLKSGLSTREIADLLNVLPSSVNVSRSRLRKKLQLGSKEDLYKFLNTV